MMVQANSSNALSRSTTRQGLGRQQSSPSRVRSAPSQRGTFGVSGNLEEGTPPVELSTSPPGTATFSRPAWLVPGAFHCACLLQSGLWMHNLLLIACRGVEALALFVHVLPACLSVLSLQDCEFRYSRPLHVDGPSRSCVCVFCRIDGECYTDMDRMPCSR